MSHIDNIYLPVISQEDFEAFRSLMHDELPTTYNEWTKRHADRAAYWRDEERAIIEVQVKPHDFANYIGTGAHGADLNRLYVFTEIVGKRNK
jgi:hypothetical protein